MISDELKKQFKQALVLSTGNIALSLQELSLEDKEKEFEIRKWVKDDPDVAAMVKVLRFSFGDKLTDQAVLKFAARINEGDPKAIENLLFKSVFGRERGFGESLNVNIAGQETGPPVINYLVVTEKTNAEIRNRQLGAPETAGLPAS